jgi:CelD/BcsL family acetyltransferase involved in cellulose biosynthesis
MVSAVHAFLQTLDASAPAAAPNLSSTVAQIDLSVHEHLDAIEPLWRDFETRADCTAFQSFAWLSAWFTAIGEPNGVRPAVVVGRQRDGRVLCVFPFAIDRLGPLRRLTWLGSHLCDYNLPLLAPEFSALVSAEAVVPLWDRIRGLLRDRGFDYDIVHLEKMPARCGSQPNPCLQLPVGLHPSHAYATHLSGDWDSFYTAKRSATTRRRDRTKRKRMAEHGEVTFATASDATEIEQALDTLIEQKIASLSAKGAANIFAPRGHSEFYRNVASERSNRDFVHVSRVDVGSTTVAVNLGLVFRGSYYHVLASHGGGELSRFGPGVMHLHELMKYAIGSGLKTFDFTIGDEAYKREWSDIDLALYDHVSAASIRGCFVVIALLVSRRAKRAIKQSPALWHAFSRGREMLAALGRRRSRAAAETERS